MHIPNGIRQSYDTRFKLMGINHAQKTTTMHQKSSMLQKQMYDDKENKSRSW